MKVIGVREVARGIWRVLWEPFVERPAQGERERARRLRQLAPPRKIRFGAYPPSAALIAARERNASRMTRVAADGVA